jgi:hypothetical protein
MTLLTLLLLHHPPPRRRTHACNALLVGTNLLLETTANFASNVPKGSIRKSLEAPRLTPVKLVFLENIRMCLVLQAIASAIIAALVRTRRVTA